MTTAAAAGPAIGALPESFEAFRNYHAGETILVCGCGASLASLTAPERFVTIGVNDVGRMFQPDYLVVLNTRHQFSGDRYQHVEGTRARAVFSQFDLAVPHSRLVRVRLGRRGGTDIDGATLPYTRNSPYVAIALAMHMGARRIGFIGVDFTDHHFFAHTGRHPLARELPQIDTEYRRLYDACAQAGIELYNLSPDSRLTGVPKVPLSVFAASSGATLRTVSYATTPVTGVPPVLTRSITARTRHEGRTVWAAAPPAQTPAPRTTPPPTQAPPRPRLRVPAPRPAASLDDVSIVVPHGGAARLRNLTVVLQALKAAAPSADVVVAEMDETPRAQALAETFGFRHVFVEQGDAFHKARAMNAGVAFVRASRFFWVDSDLVVPAEFLRTAVAEFDARALDCLIPWTSVRYLSEADSDAVAARSCEPSACRPVSVSYTRSGCRGGIALVRTEFVRQYGGMCEEFHGWGGEDNAWFLKASVLGRAAATSRQDQHIYHMFHPRTGGYGPHVAIASNPSYQRDLELLHEVRRLTRREGFLARFPPSAHATAPWIGVRTIACAPGAAAIGEALQALYGPAVHLVGEHEPADAAAGRPGTDGGEPLERARLLAARLAMRPRPTREHPSLPTRPPVEIALPSEDPTLPLPLPWADDSADVVRAHDALPFAADRIRVMNELWRILRHGGIAEISLLTTDGAGAFAHPAAVTYWNRHTFDWFVHGHPAREQASSRLGIAAAFAIQSEQVTTTTLGPRVTLVLAAVKSGH